MTEIQIPYGRGFMPLHCREEELRAVIGCGPLPGGASGERLVRRALENPIGSPPLHELAARAERVLLITSDHTRPVPSHITIPAMLREIRRGNPRAQVKILVATGLHRQTTRRELEEKLTPEVAAGEEIVIHDARTPDLSEKGTLPSGAPLAVNPLVDWADLIAADGFIEPHFFAGFSGGRKSILPGIAGEASIRANHCAALIRSERARTGILEGNPIHRDMEAAAEMANLGFILNVVLNDGKEIVHAVAGAALPAHRAGCGYCRRLFSQEGVESSVAVTSNGGYPLDQNIYQSVKSMTAAESCVRPGGRIICLSRCEDGSGGEQFVRWFAGSRGPADVLERIGARSPEDTLLDQWQAQILARIMQKAQVALVCEEKNRSTVERMGMLWFPTADAALEDARRSVADYDGVTVIPNGVSVIIS